MIQGYQPRTRSFASTAHYFQEIGDQEIYSARGINDRNGHLLSGGMVTGGIQVDITQAVADGLVQSRRLQIKARRH
jgi:hypothetical protein